MLFLLLACSGPTSGCADGDLFHVYTYEDGTFGGCTYETARDFGGVRCLGKPYTTSLWPEGSVATCYLDGAQTVAGLAFPVDTSISLYEDGSIGGWSISSDSVGVSPTVTHDGHTCTKAEIHPNGTFASCITFEATDAKPKATMTCWDESGKPLDRRDCIGRELQTPYSQWRARTKKTKR
jgi:hypothetical protein